MKPVIPKLTNVDDAVLWLCHQDWIAAPLKDAREEDLILFHHGLGMWIRNNLGFWEAECPLRRDIACQAGPSNLDCYENEDEHGVSLGPDIHPDGASQWLIERAWTLLQVGELPPLPAHLRPSVWQRVKSFVQPAWDRTIWLAEGVVFSLWNLLLTAWSGLKSFGAWWWDDTGLHSFIVVVVLGVTSLVCWIPYDATRDHPENRKLVTIEYYSITGSVSHQITVPWGQVDQSRHDMLIVHLPSGDDVWRGSYRIVPAAQ